MVQWMDANIYVYISFFVHFLFMDNSSFHSSWEQDVEAIAFNYFSLEVFPFGEQLLSPAKIELFFFSEQVPSLFT